MRSSVLTVLPVFSSYALQIPRFFNLQLLSCSPNLSSTSTKHDPSLIASLPTTSVPIPESNHLNDFHSDHSFCSYALKVLAKWPKFGFLQKGKQIHAHIIKLGLHNKLSLQNQILHLYVKCKEFDDTGKLFDEMHVRNVVTWNTVICGVLGCGFNFKSSPYLGFLYFKRMLLDNVGLDQITFNGLLRACVEINDIEMGWQLHCFIVKLGFDLNCFVSSALVDLYGKCGSVEDARRLFNKVVCRDLVFWNVMVSCYALNCLAAEVFRVYDLMLLEAFIGACKVHGEIGLAKWAAERLFHLEPDKPVSYTLVSNMYASEGYWSDVVSIRKKMRDNCNYKAPGCSWMEIAGEIHTFVSSDKSHPQAVHIYAMLGTMFGLEEDKSVSSAYVFDCDLDECGFNIPGYPVAFNLKNENFKQ
ncbi:hypothetical protein Patl1_00476 [Pistacia atlantica]|uniref:Uncharacterized protein n=1 Tax=Pistacia atlantica TaxID=434234 RepID=A0ACC1C5F8_9ROSI|nr:hypothetical protein Patl1_00476 [Pistacia atlantica]